MVCCTEWETGRGTGTIRENNHLIPLEQHWKLFCKNGHPHKREEKASLLPHEKQRDLPFLLNIINHIAYSFSNYLMRKRKSKSQNLPLPLLIPVCSINAGALLREGTPGHWNWCSHLQAYGICCRSRTAVLWVLPLVPGQAVDCVVDCKRCSAICVLQPTSCNPADEEVLLKVCEVSVSLQ